MAKTSKISIQTKDGITIVSFDSPTISSICGIDEIAEQLRDFISQNHPDMVVIDFAGVSFFCSQILGIMVDAWRRLREYGGRMLISGISPQLKRVFRITNLDKIFQFYPDSRSAIEALKGAKL